MLALALCVTAIIYIYAAPTIRKCCRSSRRPISAELVDAFKDL